MIGSHSPITWKLNLWKRLFVRHYVDALLPSGNPELYTGHPYYKAWLEMGRKYKQRFHLGFEHEDEPMYDRPNPSSCRVQVVRSVSNWSHGVLTEASIQAACEFWKYIRVVTFSFRHRHSDD